MTEKVDIDGVTREAVRLAPSALADFRIRLGPVTRGRVVLFVAASGVDENRVVTAAVSGESRFYGLLPAWRESCRVEWGAVSLTAEPECLSGGEGPLEIAAQQDLDLGRGFVKELRRPQNPSRCLRAGIRVTA